MGSNSNRNLTKAERIGKYAKNIVETSEVSSFEWQINIGAKIRGEIGIKQGNDFIEAINKIKKV